MPAAQTVSTFRPMRGRDNQLGQDAHDIRAARGKEQAMRNVSVCAVHKPRVSIVRYARTGAGRDLASASLQFPSRRVTGRRAQRPGDDGREI